MRKLKPKVFRLNHLVWKVHSVDLSDLPENTVGTCSSPFDAEIKIYEQGGLEDADTLLHECIHAMDFAYNIKLSETQVIKLGHLLTFLIRDNPWVLTYVKQKIKEEYANA